MSTLTQNELARIKREVLDNVLDVGAVPYFSILAIYEVIQQNVSSADTPPTTSSTAIATAGPVTIVVADATGLSAATMIQLDAGDARETCPIKYVSGTSVSINATKPHGGTYPIEIESPLTLVRGTLSDLAMVQQQINKARTKLGLKRVDEVEWFSAQEGGSSVMQLREEQSRLRMDLASMCGIAGWLRNAEMAGGGNVSVY